MFKTILHVAGFYFVILGTWRLANATTASPSIAEILQEKYSPLRDLISPHQIFGWLIKTIRSFKQPGWLGNAVILQKQFNYGLLWLFIGLFLQFLTGFF